MCVRMPSVAVLAQPHVCIDVTAKGDRRCAQRVIRRSPTPFSACVQVCYQQERSTGHGWPADTVPTQCGHRAPVQRHMVAPACRVHG